MKALKYKAVVGRCALCLGVRGSELGVWGRWTEGKDKG